MVVTANLVGAGGNSLQWVTATTAADGTFELAGMVRATDRLQASGSGRETAAPVAAQPRDEVRLELLARGSVRGTVLDAAGEPVSGFTIGVYRLVDGARELVRQVRSSGPAGRFELQDLDSGRYQLQVFTADGRSARSEILVVLRGMIEEIQLCLEDPAR